MFNSHFSKYSQRIFFDKIPTAWARYADGERMVITGESVGINTQAYSVDKWQSHGITTFCHDLKATLNNEDKDYFYAISCPCCDPKGCAYYQKNIRNTNKSFANLWINANYHKFIDIINNKILEEVIMIANEEGINNKYPFNVIKYFPITNDIVNYYNMNKNDICNKLLDFCDFDNKLVLISAGPFSEIIINLLWNKNNSNRYIDVGSSIDNYIHGKNTRPYLTPGTCYHGRVCSF